METIYIIRAFFGWCSVINMGLLIFSALFIIVFGKTVSRIHARMFDLDETKVRHTYFRYLGYYKIAIIVFNIVPYLALRIVG